MSIDTLNCWGIYSVSCQCGLSYIGQTKRRLIFRLNEHKLNIRNQETNKSAIAKQCWENDHTFNFHSAKIILQTHLCIWTWLLWSIPLSIKIIIMSLTVILPFLLYQIVVKLTLYPSPPIYPSGFRYKYLFLLFPIGQSFYFL